MNLRFVIVQDLSVTGFNQIAHIFIFARADNCAQLLVDTDSCEFHALA